MNEIIDLEEVLKELPGRLDNARKAGEERIKEIEDKNEILTDEEKRNIIGRQGDIAYSTYFIKYRNIFENVFFTQLEKKGNLNRDAFFYEFRDFYEDVAINLAAQLNYNPILKSELGLYYETAIIVDAINKGNFKTLGKTIEELNMQRPLEPIKYACYILSDKDKEKALPYFEEYLRERYRYDIHGALSKLEKWKNLNETMVNEFVNEKKDYFNKEKDIENS